MGLFSAWPGWIRPDFLCMGLALLPGDGEGFCLRSASRSHLAPPPLRIGGEWDEVSGRAQHPLFAEALGAWAWSQCHWLGCTGWSQSCIPTVCPALGLGPPSFTHF